VSNKSSRVLGRMGAHELTKEETEVVSGGVIPTLLSRILTNVLTNPDSIRDT
jgi:hypothetical protein